jgi:hypothetical protein
MVHKEVLVFVAHSATMPILVLLGAFLYFSLIQPAVKAGVDHADLGDTRVEAIIFDSLSRRLPQPQFCELVRFAFSDTDAEAFLNRFGFKTESMPYEEYRDAMRLFLSAAMFQIPNFGIAESSGEHTYLYHFEEPSHTQGRHSGSHITANAHFSCTTTRATNTQILQGAPR